jgi:guanosine-3',5'-bis(diphosphate) 3'-pyrophosphohydrolase
MITEQEQLQITNKYNILSNLAQALLKEEDREILSKAYLHAREVHGDFRRETGELSILHALSIARITVEEMGLGAQAAIAALFHDCINSNLTNLKDIENLYGTSVSMLVNGFNRLSELPTDRVSLQSENFRKLFLTLVDDIRTILLKLAHRLYDMRAIEKLTPEKQMRFHNEVIHIYSPIAHRLGLYRIKKELEELSMKFTDPGIYQEIAQKIRDTESKRNVFIKQFATPIQKELYAQGFKFEIKGRPKSIPSIWNKMQGQHLEFDQVYDLFAIRIIIDTPVENEKSDCWRVYSIVTNIYQPNPKRLRDWITSPKASGYESLHTTVKGPNDRWVEVQIRTNRMDEIAEKGQAAHWMYKGFGSKKDSDEWLNQVRDIIEHPEQLNFEEIEKATGERKSNKVFIFTPNGDLKELEEGATVLDFAFEIHTSIGYACTGARVNNKIVPLKQKLNNGDKVEIITSKIQKPKIDWLNFVTTTKAKNRIKRALKEEQFVEADKGNEILRRKFRNWKIPFSDENIDKLIKKYKLSSALDLYALVFQEKIDLIEIKRVLSNVPEKETELKPSQVADSKTAEDITPARPKTTDVLMIDRKLDKVNYVLARCCNPIPGDPVFGFVTISRGITIHRKNCPNASQLLSRYGYRKIEVQWKVNEETVAFQTAIRITGLDKLGMMNAISQVISNDLKVNMQSVKIDAKDGIFQGNIKIVVKSTQHLDELLHKLSKIPGVIRAVRMD